jgi:hypothetical protein
MHAMKNTTSFSKAARPLRSRQRRGNAIVELGLLAMPLVVMLMGTVVVGLNLGRSIQAGQINRDAGSMYVRGVDFSADFNRNILIRLAQGLGLSATGGKGIVIFSKVTWIPSATCVALSLNPCNSNKHVIVQRLTLGDTSLRTSALGTPAPTLIDGKGYLSNYMINTTAIATFPYMQLGVNEYAYVVESYFSSPDFDLPGFMEGTGVYNISVY